MRSAFRRAASAAPCAPSSTSSTPSRPRRGHDDGRHRPRRERVPHRAGRRGKTGGCRRAGGDIAAGLVAPGAARRPGRLDRMLGVSVPDAGRAAGDSTSAHGFGETETSPETLAETLKTQDPLDLASVAKRTERVLRRGLRGVVSRRRALRRAQGRRRARNREDVRRAVALARERLAHERRRLEAIYAAFAGERRSATRTPFAAKKIAHARTDVRIVLYVRYRLDAVSGPGWWAPASSEGARGRLRLKSARRVSLRGAAGLSLGATSFVSELSPPLENAPLPRAGRLPVSVTDRPRARPRATLSLYARYVRPLI